MRSRIAVILEGESREFAIWKSISRYFFPNTDIDLFFLPAKGNIYMLWKQTEQDNQETDLIELIRDSDPAIADQLKDLRRDDFQEIYLFFDLDPHQDNLGIKDAGKAEEIVEHMLETFDNETELGKLYLSYPMVEALRDYRAGTCRAHTDCFYPVKDTGHYKHDSAQNNPNSNTNRYIHATWLHLVAIFIQKCYCLMGRRFADGAEDTLRWYWDVINPLIIYQRQRVIMNEREKVFVLSAFPEFLLDYFREDYWLTLDEEIKRISADACPLSFDQHPHREPGDY